MTNRHHAPAEASILESGGRQWFVIADGEGWLAIEHAVEARP